MSPSAASGGNGDAGRGGDPPDGEYCPRAVPAMQTAATAPSKIRFAVMRPSPRPARPSAGPHRRAARMPPQVFFRPATGQKLTLLPVVAPVTAGRGSRGLVSGRPGVICGVKKPGREARMAITELRDLTEARRYVLQGLWLQRVARPVAGRIKPVLEWALEIASNGHPLTPVGFVA